MSNTALAIIEKEIRSNDVMARISDSLGKPATDPSVKKFINGAIMYMQSKVGQKGDISHCTRQSIIDSLINAATVRLPVDNKHYACLVAYKDVCNFQPEWRGYVAKIKEADSSSVVTVGIVFKGDTFTFSKEDSTATYKHVPANAFEDNPANISGAYCFIKTATGSYIEVMSRKELDTVRGSSKVGYDYIWKSWPLEMYKKTIIRRACKVKFTEAVSDLDALDNKMYTDKTQREIPTIAKTAPMPAEVIEDAEVIKDGEEGKKADTAGLNAELLAKAEEAKKRKEELEAKEKAEKEAKNEAGKADTEAGATSADTSLEPGQMAAEGLINAVIDPKGRSSYTKFTIRGCEGKFFSTNNPITTAKLIAAKEEEKPVRIIYTETEWSGGMNQNIVSAEVLTVPVSEERAY